MVKPETFRQIALSFPGTIEQPHFEKTSFRVKKKIFATLSIDNNTAVLKLSLIDQSVFCTFDKTIIYPVNGAWGKQGWTVVELNKIRKPMLKDALSTAYSEVNS
jgi:predicted DNA-binding protein (MmcQ/YjbR family)